MSPRLCQNSNRRSQFNFCRYSIITAEEWSKLTQFYEVDYPITVKKTDDDYQTNPGKCKPFAAKDSERFLY